jgi:hypothetical protein
MSSTYQRASTRRKITYGGTLVGLFVVTLLIRGVFFGASQPAWTIRKQAEELELTELNQGKAELTGSAIRLLLTGSRGLAVCGLWISAIEKQRREEWNELELLVKSTSKLQPHFITPWMFQSWNLAYNVSVELDRLNDMYFYISRGISLLAEGEELNKNNPDMRYYVAFYYQNKFGVSDKVDTLRCLYQLSCIPPEKRNPATLTNADGSVNDDNFEKFCRENPQLVRRLRESKIKAESKDQVLQFLKSNFEVRNRYRDGEGKELRPRLDQFPVLPSGSTRPGELKWDAQLFTDRDGDGFLAARAWFAYSLDACPPLPPEAERSPYTCANPQPDSYDRRKYRKPKQPAYIIFRQGRPRAQSYIAERLQQEGWFDTKATWNIDSSSGTSIIWFPGKTVELQPSDTARDAWNEAYNLWKTHGAENAMDLTQEQVQKMSETAVKFAASRNFPPGISDGGNLSTEELNDQSMVASYNANRNLNWYSTNERMTQFQSFLYQSEAEKEADVIEARRLTFEAKQAYKRDGNPRESIRLFADAFKLWQTVLTKFTRFRGVEKTQDEVYEVNLEYVSRLIDRDKRDLRESVLAIHDMMSWARITPSPLQATLNLQFLEEKIPVLKTLEPLPIAGPLDGLDPAGNPWIPDETKERVRSRLGLDRKPTAAVSPPPVPGNQPKQ